ncbi:MAG: tRNA (adenosine(37)-N6)-threonylcarbamoyltransferase complex ATPase subunit type 1 TsaE [Bacteriovoracaceae bacterium]|nr:tRNA (adenosine(37)-N6)-threonylcarbamoyltransferase complex ATPase subunit type 1 TsaE [Bacteriovoracaceae bacterium]
MKRILLKKWEEISQNEVSALCLDLKNMLQTPALIILTGDLGSGKTFLVDSFLKNNGQKQGAQSPTFSLLQEHEDVLHGDFYRLKSSEEIEYLELPLLLENKKLFFLEWGKDYLQAVVPYLEESVFFYEIEILSVHETRSYFLYQSKK